MLSETPLKLLRQIPKPRTLLLSHTIPGTRLPPTECEYFDPVDPSYSLAILEEYLFIPPMSDNTRNSTFFHVLFYMSWTDEVIYEITQDFMAASVEKAKELGVYNKYMYMPYSSPYKPVISGYEEVNVARLNRTAKKYDPMGVFQRLQPGYFKLDGATPFGEVI